MIRISENRTDLKVTYKGITIFEFYLAPTTDGITFGIKDNIIGDIHYTIFYKDGKLRSHITDKTNTQQYPWGHQITPEILIKKILKRVNKWIRPYHGNKIAYIMSDNLKAEIINMFDEIYSTNNLPFELNRTYIECDFTNSKRWKKVKIRELIEIKEIGHIYDGNIIKMVFPINKNEMICCSERQFENLRDKIFQEIGLYDYLDYIVERDFKPNL